MNTPHTHPNRESRMLPLGFLPTRITEGQKVIVTTRLPADVMDEFHPTRLFVAAGAEYFLIHDLTIDGKSQLVAPGAIPAVAFGVGMVGTAMGMDAVRDGAEVAITVEHVAVRRPNWLVRAIRRLLWIEDGDRFAKAHMFSATLVGYGGNYVLHPADAHKKSEEKIQ